jgi:hypothetical protein
MASGVVGCGCWVSKILDVAEVKDSEEAGNVSRIGEGLTFTVPTVADGTT